MQNGIKKREGKTWTGTFYWRKISPRFAVLLTIVFTCKIANHLMAKEHVEEFHLSSPSRAGRSIKTPIRNEINYIKMVSFFHTRSSPEKEIEHGKAKLTGESLNNTEVGRQNKIDEKRWGCLTIDSLEKSFFSEWWFVNSLNKTVEYSSESKT